MADRGNYRSTYTVMLDSEEYRALLKDAKSLLLHIKHSRVNNLAGIFVCDEGELVTLSKQSSIPLDDLKKLIPELEKTRWIIYESDLLWDRNQLFFDPGINLNNKNHKKAVERVLRALPVSSLIAKFCNYYKLPIPTTIPSRYHRDTIEIPSPIKEKEKEKEQEKETEQEKEAIDRILLDFKAVTGLDIKLTTREFRRLTRDRIRDGATFEEFQHVHRVKTEEWQGDDKMDQYLNPGTLYRPTKFPKYVLQKAKPKVDLEQVWDQRVGENG